MKRNLDIQVHEVQRSPNKLKEIFSKTQYNKTIKNPRQRISKAAREKLVTYKGTPILLPADFSAETSRARREWDDMFKELKEKNCQARILCLAKLSLRNGETDKDFPR